jgi:nucleotidyltransferase/DNA polymerase involved in DNA repair
LIPGIGPKTVDRLRSQGIETLAQLADQERRVPPVRELAPEVPDSVEAAVMRCLARNSRYRPASAAELAADLRTRPTEPLTVPLTPQRTARSRARTLPLTGPIYRTRWASTRVLLLGAVLLMLTAIAVAVAANGGGGSRTPTTPQRVSGVPASSDAAQQARNLEQWIRGHTAAG